MLVRSLLLLGLGLLDGCAQVHIYQCTNADCSSWNEKADGIRYYLPKPYLLVAEAPVDTTQLNITGKNKDVTMTLSTGDNSADKSGKGDSTSDGSSTSPGGASDTSFGLATEQYQLKLVYLPDTAHPMLLQTQPGLFGSAEVKPQLQDGWMLTGVDATADSKAADTLSAIASFLHGGGSSSTGSSKGNKDATSSAIAKAIAPDAGDVINAQNQHPNLPVLPPGLYAIEFDDGTDGPNAVNTVTKKFSGTVKGLKRVALFCNNGIVSGDATACP